MQRLESKLFVSVSRSSTVCKGQSQSCSFWFPYFHSMQRPKSKLFVSVSVVPQYAEAGVKAVRFSFRSSSVCRGWSQSCSFWFPVVAQYAEAGVKAIGFALQFQRMQRPKTKLFVLVSVVPQQAKAEVKAVRSVSVVPQYAEAAVKAIRFGFPQLHSMQRPKSRLFVFIYSFAACKRRIQSYSFRFTVSNKFFGRGIFGSQLQGRQIL